MERLGTRTRFSAGEKLFVDTNVVAKVWETALNLTFLTDVILDFVDILLHPEILILLTDESVLNNLMRKVRPSFEKGTLVTR